MRLKRLELFGFKSFADRTVFEFGDNTLTGVVGPNGCGKSNVVDSVRWVLGEQRPTSMRGAEMIDVIFKGSSSRPALSVAEVTLILDNSGGSLEGRGPEVGITRRVFRSGEGEYLLDGERVRLKDVREMLFDTGLGSRGYAVLEQGKIDAVLSANPLDRRRIFEEAAGISRYRQRKIEAELRLKRVEGDMTRLDDVIGELATRVRSLKIQAGKAERYVEARTEWARERERYFKHRLWLFDRELQELSGGLGGLEARATQLRSSRSTSESEVEVRERERTTLSAEVDRLVADLSRLSGDGRALDERRAQLSGRVSGWQAAAREEGERARKLESGVRERELESARLSAEVGALEERNRVASALATECTRALSELERGQRELKENAQHENESLLSRLHRRTDLENRVRHLSESRATAHERGERQNERLSAAREAAAAMGREEAQAAQRVQDAQDAQAGQDQTRRDMAQRLAELATRSAEVERERNQLELERTRSQSLIEFLLDRERDLEELSKAARRVLESVGQSSEPCTTDELLGLVADHLRTDTRHARALDAVLSVRGSALVARDRETALCVAAWLKSSEAGQVGLVLPQGVADVVRETAPAFEGQESELISGRLLEHVRCAAEFAPLADLLCGDVHVVRDLSSAFVLVERHPRLRFVTLEGELVDAAGVLGGTRALTQGAVGRRASADDLSAEVELLAAKIHELDERRASIGEARLALQGEWERSSQELEARRQVRAQAESALATARARLRDLSAAVRALEQESGAISEESSRLERDLSASQAQLAVAKSDFERESASLATLEARRDGLEKERERCAREAGIAQVEAARAHTELEGKLRARHDLEHILSENRAELERALRLAGEHRESAVEGAEECERLSEKSTEVLEERARLDQRLTELRAVAEGGRDAIEGLRRRAEAVTRELEETSATIAARRLEEQRLHLARAEILARAKEDLDLEPDRLREGFEPEQALRESSALEDLDASVRELKSRLDKLGPVNMEALGELSEVGGRHEFLQRQRADLVESRDQLNQAVRTIDTESKRLFLETFDAVRANFQRIFRQLFGGGRADVQLEEGLDVLDAGVEIVARPPGRELLSIGLLSGGQRTLTALALLFAVFEARPSPFCILDEVDAALDDANIDRFLAMLGDFRRGTQFVVVTHNKGTMTACESLYGVTMETKGVSRQVSVELSDVDRFTEPPARDARGARDIPPVREVVLSRPGPYPAPALPDVPDADDMDGESGEPVVEILPASLGADGALRGGTSRRKRRVPVPGPNLPETPAPAVPPQPSG